MEDLRPETVAAIAAVRRALALAAAGTGAIHFKDGRDVVTDTDVAIEDEIRDLLDAAFEIPVVGEERGGESKPGAPHWLVDPICGTRNYASGIPLFAVNLALVEKERVTVAVVGDGSSGAVYVAELGRGAWQIDNSVLTRISVSPASGVVDVGGWPRSAAARDRAAQFAASLIAADQWDIRCFSTTLALSYVAVGRLSACVLLSGPAAVHVGAGSLLVAEAGATVSELGGGPWSLGSTSLLACAGIDLHAAIVDMAGAAGLGTEE